jgi:hypothetical protein
MFLLGDQRSVFYGFLIFFALQEVDRDGKV